MDGAEADVPRKTISNKRVPSFSKWYRIWNYAASQGRENTPNTRGLVSYQNFTLSPAIHLRDNLPTYRRKEYFNQLSQPFWVAFLSFLTEIPAAIDIPPE
jgi:hypothetical protein